MTSRELDQLLNGAEGLDSPVIAPDGTEIVLRFDRHALLSPVAFRAVLRRGLGHLDYTPPTFSQEEHDQLVRVMFRAADPDG